MKHRYGKRRKIMPYISSINELMKQSKTHLIDMIVQSISILSKKKLAVLYYQIQKAKLPILPLKKRVWSKKQLAAQRLFTKRARAGTLRRR